MRQTCGPSVLNAMRLDDGRIGSTLAAPSVRQRSTSTSAPGNEWERVSRTTLARALSIYRPESIDLSSASWDGTTVRGTFSARGYLFARPGFLQYITAPTAVLYASQLAYLFGYLSCESRKFPPDFPLTLDDYLAARDRGLLVIDRFAIVCRRKIATPAEAVVDCFSTAHHVLRGRLFARMSFVFNRGMFVAQALLVVPNRIVLEATGNERSR